MKALQIGSWNYFQSLLIFKRIKKITVRCNALKYFCALSLIINFVKLFETNSLRNIFFTQEQCRDVGVGDGLAEVAGEALQVVAAPLHQLQDLPDCAHHLGPRLAQTLIQGECIN